MRKKERFVLGKRTFRSQKSKHFVLRIINTNEKFKGTAILDDDALAVPSVTLSTEGSAIEFAVSGGVVDGDDAVVNEPMQWVVVVRKNGKEIDRKTLIFEDGKQISADDLKLYYK